MIEKTLLGEEAQRYSRQLLLDEVGVNGQLKLKQARVLVIGAGGLGIPVLQYLAAAGVGTIGIVDDDWVELSNLQRQVLYATQDVGKKKVAVAEQKISAINPLLLVTAHDVRLSSQNAMDIISDYDLIIDGSDNFPTRYLVNDVCVKADKPFVSGAVFRFSGQLGVFNFKHCGTYRCLFPQPPASDDRPDCNTAGVIGTIPGTIGVLMANEAIKVICGIGEVLMGKLLVIDFLNMKVQTLSFCRDELAVKQIIEKKILNQGDYTQECHPQTEHGVKEMTPETLHAMMASNESFQLIDVREPFEREAVNIGGDFIPFSEVMRNTRRISHDRPVIFYCKTGVRSRLIIQRLQAKLMMDNLYNLRGGIVSYLASIPDEA